MNVRFLVMTGAMVLAGCTPISNDVGVRRPAVLLGAAAKPISKMSVAKVTPPATTADDGSRGQMRPALRTVAPPTPPATMDASGTTGAAQPSVTNPETRNNAAIVQPSVDQRLAEDAVQELAKIMAPAHTTLHVWHAASEPFGEALLSQLRREGFGVVEPERVKRHSGRIRARAPSPHEFWYLKDRIDDMDMIRVEMGVGTRKLSRLYLMRDGQIYGAGVWAHRE